MNQLSDKFDNYEKIHWGPFEVAEVVESKFPNFIETKTTFWKLNEKLKKILSDHKNDLLISTTLGVFCFVVQRAKRVNTPY